MDEVTDRPPETDPDTGRLPDSVAGRGLDAMKAEDIAATYVAPVTNFGIAAAAEAAKGGRS